MASIVSWISSHTYLTCLITGTVVASIWLILMRKRLNFHWTTMLGLSLLHTCFGVFGAVALGRFETYVFQVPGNVRMFGAVFIMPLFYYVSSKITKRKTAEFSDVFTVGMIIVLMFARVDCFIEGCCGGSMISGLTNLRWPIREFEMILYLAMIILLGQRVIKEKSYGMNYAILMIYYGGYRFISDFFREEIDQPGIFHLAHIWALISLGLGLSIYAEQKIKAKKKNRR